MPKIQVSYNDIHKKIKSNTVSTDEYAKILTITLGSSVTNSVLSYKMKVDLFQIRVRTCSICSGYLHEET